MSTENTTAQAPLMGERGWWEAGTSPYLHWLYQHDYTVHATQSTLSWVLRVLVTQLTNGDWAAMTLYVGTDTSPTSPLELMLRRSLFPWLVIEASFDAAWTAIFEQRFGESRLRGGR